MQREVKKSLIQKQHILDHVTKAFGLVIAVKVVPTHSTQPNLEPLLHSARLFRTKKLRQHNDAVRLEFRVEPINSCTLTCRRPTTSHPLIFINTTHLNIL